MNAFLRCAVLLFAGSAPALLPALPAQDDPAVLERLRRDQDEVLRKAERIQALMLRLQERYQREQKPEQVKLLADGMAHLERSGILREVASIRDDLAATALTEALRKQREVVDDLERLLAILLERNSVENLQQELARIAAEARSARELEQRQRELMERTRQAMQTPPSPAEQALIDGLAGLRDAERAEAERNQRDAGTRRPFLESALQRVRELLAGQQRLEQGLADEASGQTPTARAREFDLGDLTERTRELAADLRDQATTRSLGEAAKELQQQAAGSDQAALEQARDRLQSGLQQAPKRGKNAEGKARDQDWAALKDRLKEAGEGTTPQQREELGKVGEAGEQLAGERDREATAANTRGGEQLAETAEKVAAKLREDAQAQAPGGDAAKDPAAAAVAEAKQRLDEAAKASQSGDVAAAQKKVAEALAALDRAKAEHQKQHPDATRKAAEMAAEAAATAQELANAPSGEKAEQAAGEQLQQAATALRDVAAAGERTPDGKAETTAPARQQSAGQSRQALEQAERTLQEAMQGASQGNEADMQAAQERQQKLAETAKAAAEQLQQAAASGQVTPQQRDKAQEKLQQARDRMQAAAEKLQAGQQSGAAGEQKAAADAVEQAIQALDQQRPPSETQKQDLKEQAKAQQQLAEDIVQLAEELKKRDNKAAQRKAQAAADAAQKAQRAMEQGDPEETQEQQEEARQNLEEAAKELEQEEDRYQDLRQEELLFRMKDELTQFLERQRPITAQTVEAAKSASVEGLARPVRRKLNQLGEEETELSNKVHALVQALTEEGNLVYRTVLDANVEDLREVARRLAGRSPDVGTFTTLLQQDVERRTEDLLKALERERQRRDQQRKEQQAQSQQDKGRNQNRFDPQRQKLVGLIAELEMLKQLGVDTKNAAENLRTLVETRGDDVISDAEVAMIERLANRHGEITKLFQQIKAGVESTLQSMAEEGAEPTEGGRGR